MTTAATPAPAARPGGGFDVFFPLFLGLACAALGVLLHVRCFPIGDVDLETDFYGDLVLAARNVAEGRFSVHDFPWKGPLYAFLLVPLRWLAGDWYRGAVALSAAAGGASLALAYRLVLHHFDRRTAVLAVALSAAVVEFCVQFHRASTDVLFLFLCLASIASTLHPGGSARRLAAAGGLGGLAFLTRYNGIFLLGGTALVVLLLDPDGLARRRRTALFGIYCAAFAGVCLPWFAANWVEANRILPTSNIANIAAAFYGDPRWEADPASTAADGWTLVASHPGHFAVRYARNLAGNLQRDMTQLLGWPLALVPLAGVLGAVVRPATRRQAGLYVFAGAYWLCMGFVFYAPRFFLPMILPYMVLGASLVRRWNGDEGRLGRLRLLFARSPRGLAPASLVVLVLVTIGVQAWRVFDMERNIHARRPLALLEAARVLERSSHDAPARPRLMARKGHLAYHAGFDFAPIAPGIASLEALVRQAQQRHAGYVAYSYVEYSLLPHLLFMAVTDTVPLLRETYRGPGVRVFRVPEDTTSALSHAQRHELLRANLKAARLQGRPAAVLAACEALGSHHLRRGEPAPAADFFAEALALAEGAPGDDAMARAAAMARHNLAAAKIGLGQPATAIGLLQRNLDYFATAGSPADIERTRELLQRAQARRDAASIPTAPRP